MKQITASLFKLNIMIALLLVSCGSSENLVSCSSSSIDIGFNSCLTFENENAFSEHITTIENVIRESLVLVNTKFNIEDLRIKVRANSLNAIQEIGIGGFNPNENEIIISIDPDFPNLSTSITLELGPLMAHEMHHAKRRRVIGYGSTLLGAVVSEGIADCFSMEVYAIDPPIWSTVFTEKELEEWIETASNDWDNTNYNHAKWFHGTTTEIPRWAGYSIGFKLIKTYLIAHPEQKASLLVAEPAGSFID